MCSNTAANRRDVKDEEIKIKKGKGEEKSQKLRLCGMNGDE